ncbi:MAG: hypothetical protein FWE59_07230 [Oscillospiraceae bacterium]|nr:hypothetical protein [Oscillospiraceae bacterium]
MAKEEPKLGVLPPGHIREFDFAAKLFESLRNTPVHRDDTGRNDMDAAARNELYETCMRMAPQMLRDCRLFDLTEGMRASDEDGESVPVCVDNLPFPVVGIRTGYRCLGEESAPALAVVAEANPADPGPGDR